MQTMNRLDKYIRVAIGLFIIAVSTRMWFVKPDLIPWYAVLGAWIFGAGVAFSTVVRGLLREFFPFFNRRGIGPVSEASTSDIPPASAQQDATGLIDLPKVDRRKPRKKK